MEIVKTFIRSLSNLKSYYQLENGAFTTDSGASGKTLTNNGTVAEGVGKYGVGADFGASNSTKYFTSSNSSYLPTGDFTYSLWFKTAMTGGGHWIICDNNGGGAGLTLRMNSNTNIQARIMQNGGSVGDLNITSLTAFNDNAWHHVVFTRTGSAMVLYLDNAVIGSGNSTGNPNFSAAKNLYFGSYFNGSQDFFSGLIDDVAILDIGITADVVDLLYRDKNYIGELRPQAGLVGGWSLNGSSTDFSGNNNRGTDTAITYSQANGKFGQGAGFNGSSSKITVADNAVLRITTDFTILAWAKPTAVNINAGIVAKDAAGSNANWRLIFNSAKMRFTIPTVVDIDDTGASVVAGVWQQVGIIHSGTSYKFILNGNINSDISQGAGITAGGTSVFHIGTAYGANYFFNGAIDEVQIYNVAKDARWVRQQYAMAMGRYL